MRINKRLFVALLVVTVLALIPAACGDSISGGRSLSVYGQGSVVKGNCDDESSRKHY